MSIIGHTEVFFANNLFHQTKNELHIFFIRKIKDGRSARKVLNFKEESMCKSNFIIATFDKEIIKEDFTPLANSKIILLR